MVATAAGGIPEIVKDEVTGLLAPVQDAEKLAEQVLRLLQDEVLAQRLTKGAWELLQDFSFRQTAKKTLGIYENVVDLK